MRHGRLHPALSAAALAAWLVAPAPVRAQQQAQPRIGVVVLVHGGLSDAEADGVSDALGRGLRSRLMVDVIAGAEATRRLPPEGVPGSCMIEQACTADIAQRLAVDQVLYLVVNRIGGRFSVDATWVDPASMRTVSRPAVAFDRVEEAEAHFAESAALLLPDAAARPVPVTPVEPAQPVSGVVQPEPDPDPDSVFIERTAPRRMTTGAWIAAGAGVALVGGAVTFTLLTRKDYTDCDDSGSCSDSKLDRLERKALAADLLWGAALGAAITTGALWWLSGGEVERVPASPPIVVGGPDGSFGLTVRGPL